MNLVIRKLGLAAVLVATLTACGGGGSGSGSAPIQVEGIWGGVLNQSGDDFAIFAMDVTTTSTGVVSGDGAIRFAASANDVPVSVSGATTPTSIAITLTDVADDTIIIDARKEGRVYRGTWRYPSGSLEGSVRVVSEENVDLLSLGTSRADRLTIREALED